MKIFFRLIALLIVFIPFNIFAQQTLDFDILKPSSRLDTVPETQVVFKTINAPVNLIGQPAPEILMRDRYMVPVSLERFKTPYVLLLFWDPECGHCIVRVPQLDSLYKNFLKKMNCEVIGINLGNNRQQWTDFIDEHHLEWINVCDFEQQSDFRAKYGVTSSPVIFILDSEHKVLAKATEIDKAKDLLLEIAAAEKQHEVSTSENNKTATGSVTEAPDENIFTVYPNPFGDEFMLYLPEISDKVSVSVFAADGKLVFTDSFKPTNSTVTVSTGDKHLAAGMYVIKTKTPGHTYSRKLMKG